ncbi:hypothetical protein G6F18_013930 [Rhizopus arrhizus]|nr:hypothetical protein G6F18_013930 [Rhizopus arrhizus]
MITTTTTTADMEEVMEIWTAILDLTEIDLLTTTTIATNKDTVMETSLNNLNRMISDISNNNIETNYDPSQIELCAAIRPERPPDVTTATPYNKIKPTSKSKGKQPTLARKVVTRSHLEEIQPIYLYKTGKQSNKNELEPKVNQL